MGSGDEGVGRPPRRPRAQHSLDPRRRPCLVCHGLPARRQLQPAPFTAPGAHSMVQTGVDRRMLVYISTRQEWVVFGMGTGHEYPPLVTVAG